MSDIKIREARIEDLDRCFDIETVSYEGDEAATREKIEKRIATYPEGYIVLEAKGEVAGFINSGATHKVALSDEEFKELIGHDPEGEHIVIMSVVVHPDHQGKGFAGLLMEDFISRMRQMNKSSIYLICQTGLIKMYEKFGFQYLCESESDHGGMKWHEMSLALKQSKIHAAHTGS